MSRSIMLVFAHPDDESFGPSGTAAKYRESGIPTDLICATRGEVGSRLDVPEDMETGKAREAELRTAAAIIGLRDLYFLDFTDGQLDKISLSEATEKIFAVMKKVLPEVVITFGPDGISGHPDHIAVGKAATMAFHRLTDKNKGPRKLYFVTIPESLLPEAEALGIRTRPDREVTIAIDITDFWDLKKKAIAAHRSQQDARDFIEMLNQIKDPGSWLKEYYYLAWPEKAVRETDLFAPWPG